MFSVFQAVVLPVFLMAMVGVIVHRCLKLSPDPISTLTLYVFSPALVFSSLIQTTVGPEDVLEILTFVLGFTFVMGFASWIVTRLLRFDRSRESAFLLVTLFMNAGNFGLPVALLAFGEQGLERAIVFFTAQAVLGGTLAVFLASRSGASMKEALVSIFRIPLLYGALLALPVTLLNVTLPQFILQPADILGDAAIPSMLMVLGIQLSSNPRISEVKAVVLATILRLLVSVPVALVLTTILGISGQIQGVLVILSGMPTAVFVIILATRFNARPSFVTGVVMVGTVASLLTLTGWITFLGWYL